MRSLDPQRPKSSPQLQARVEELSDSRDALDAEVARLRRRLAALESELSQRPAQQQPVTPGSATPVGAQPPAMPGPGAPLCKKYI